jgi:hypothetical protein
MRVEIGTPSVVSRAATGSPAAAVIALALVSESVTRCAHRSHPEAGLRCVRQHAVRSAPGPAPCRRFALRLLVRHRARCFGPTSAISRLRTSTRASWVPDFGHGLDARACRGTSWFTPERLASADRTVGFSFMARALSSPRHVCGRASDTPVAPSATALCAHALVAVSVAAEAAPTGRVKRYLWESGPRCLPFDKDLCPAMPFRAPWLEPSPEARFRHRDPGCRRLFTNVVFRIRWPGSGSRAPLPPGTRFSRASATLADFLQPWIRRAGTPDRAARSSRASCRHQPMPVALAATRFRAETGEPRTCTTQVVGRSAREKARRVSRTISHVPSSWRFGHPWSPVRLFARLDIPARVRPGQDPKIGWRLAKGDTV